MRPGVTLILLFFSSGVEDEQNCTCPGPQRLIPCALQLPPVLSLHTGLVEGTQEVQPTEVPGPPPKKALNRSILTADHTGAPVLPRSTYEPPEELHLQEPEIQGWRIHQLNDIL